MLASVSLPSQQRPFFLFCRRLFSNTSSCRMPSVFRWTPSESHILARRVSLFGENWQRIADGFIRHDANDCFNKWSVLSSVPSNTSPTTTTTTSISSSSHHNPTQWRKGRWSPEEDDKLRDVYTNMDRPHWHVVSKSVGTRSPDQCRSRWCRLNNPTQTTTTTTTTTKRSRWTRDETLDLLNAVESMLPLSASRTHWSTVAQSIYSNRSGVSCQSRFRTLIGAPPSDLSMRARKLAGAIEARARL